MFCIFFLECARICDKSLSKFDDKEVGACTIVVSARALRRSFLVFVVAPDGIGDMAGRETAPEESE